MFTEHEHTATIIGMAHFREELRQIPDLEERARRFVQIRKETTAELRQIELRLARDLHAQGKSMAQIGRAFGVSRSRAHQLVHARLSAEGRRAHNPDRSVPFDTVE